MLQKLRTRSRDSQARTATGATPRAPKAALGALLALTLLSCDAPLGATRAVDEAPYMASFELNHSNFRDGGVFTLAAVPFDGGFRVPKGEFIALELSTSRGDAELMKLVPMLCGATLCHEATLEMLPGVSLLEFETRIHNAGARLSSAYDARSRPQAGRVWALDGNISRVANELRRHPTVASVEPLGMYRILPTAGHLAAILHGGIPLANVAVRPRDGTLSFAPGDTVFARYDYLDGFSREMRWFGMWFNTP